MWQWHVYILEVKKLASYRVDFWLRMVFAAATRILLGYYLWESIYEFNAEQNKVTTIAGYSFAQMVNYYIVASFVTNAVLVSFGSFASEIYEGSLTRYLLYPVSVFQYKLITNLAHWTLCMFQLYLALFVASVIFKNNNDVITLSFTNLALSTVSCFLAAYLYMSMQAVLEMLSFWFESVFGLLVSLYFMINFFGGGVLPLALFPEWSQKLLQYTPFPWVIALPVNILTGAATLENALFGLSMSLLWCVILSLILNYTWRRGLLQYSSVGI